MYLNSFTPYTMLPVHITPRSKTLIDIFYNNFNESIISVNLIADISDHLAQFIIAPKILQQEPKKIIYKCFKNLNGNLFENNLKNINWGPLFNLELNDVNFFFPTYSKNK